MRSAWHLRSGVHLGTGMEAGASRSGCGVDCQPGLPCRSGQPLGQMGESLQKLCALLHALCHVLDDLVTHDFATLPQKSFLSCFFPSFQTMCI